MTASLGEFQNLGKYLDEFIYFSGNLFLSPPTLFWPTVLRLSFPLAIMQHALRTIQQLEEHRVELSPKRASIALIIRVPGYSRPNLETWISDLPASAEPELLFIKRTVDKRDRWSGHIAVPGGRQDPGETDLETAVRETREEVGIDLDKDGFYVGALDQRPLKVSWGRRLALVLCPFVLVLNNPDAAMSPQWSEVATCFWYPFSRLFDESYSVHEHVTVGDRVKLSFLPSFLARFIRWQIGDMLFSAIEMHPDTIEPSPTDLPPAPPPPYKVWGVTLGVLVDLFEIIRPGVFPKAAFLPTMRAWDMRFVIYVISSFSRRSKMRQLAADLQQTGPRAGRLDLINKMLAGHFAYLQKGIVLTLLLRVVGLVYLIKKVRSG